MDQEPPRKIKPAKCSNCGGAVSEKYRPFCSKRCADIDLGRWLTGRYAIKGSQDSDEDGGMPDFGSSRQNVDEDDTPGRQH